MYVTPSLTGDLCSSLVSRAVMCMSPSSCLAIVFESCRHGVGVYVTPSPFPDQRLVFESCKQVGCVYVTPPPSLTGQLCLSLVGRAVVCSHTALLTGDLCWSVVDRAIVCSSPPP